MIAPKYLFWPVFWLIFQNSWAPVLGRRLLWLEDETIEEHLKMFALEETSYAKMYRRSLEDFQQVIKAIHEHKIYENRYKMMHATFDVLLKTLYGSIEVLVNSPYVPGVSPFPGHDRVLLSAIAVTLENPTLLGELIYYNPEMAVRVLDGLDEKYKTSWKEAMNYSYKFAQNFYDRVVDENTQELMALVDQEINPERRGSDFFNPNWPTTTPKPKKKRRTAPKGPRMSVGNERPSPEL